MIGCSVISGRHLFSRMFPGQRTQLAGRQVLVGEILQSGSRLAQSVLRRPRVDARHWGTPRFIRAESGAYATKRAVHASASSRDGIAIAFTVDFHFERFDPGDSSRRDSRAAHRVRSFQVL